VVATHPRDQGDSTVTEIFALLGGGFKDGI
jgi:hypothetical protein